MPFEYSTPNLLRITKQIKPMHIFLQFKCEISFSGIVSDLFPRMIEEAVDYGALEKSIKASCLEMLLQDVDG